jgi:hypothetical protein
MEKGKEFIIGGVGHRILPLDQIFDIERKLEISILDCAKRANGIQNLTLITGLAPGADTLIFRKGKSMGIRLYALLPMNMEEYRKDFTNLAYRLEFESNLTFCTKVEILENSGKRPQCYQKLGEEIVKRSDALLAIWDGKPARGMGGTAEVIERAGKKNIEIFNIKI